MASVDLGSANTKFNPLVPSLFAAFTVLFVVTVVAHRKKNSDEERARVVAEARTVYVRTTGSLGCCCSVVAAPACV